VTQAQEEQQLGTNLLRVCAARTQEEPPIYVLITGGTSCLVVGIYARRMVTRYHYNNILACKMINFLMLFVVGDLFELIGGPKKLECTVNFFFSGFGEHFYACYQAW
jgi:hypothetical protein